MTSKKSLALILKALENARQTQKKEENSLLKLKSALNALKFVDKEKLEKLINESKVNHFTKTALLKFSKKITDKGYSKNATTAEVAKSDKETSTKKEATATAKEYDYSKFLKRLRVEIGKHEHETPIAQNLLENIEKDKSILPQIVKSKLGHTAFPTEIKKALQKLVPTKIKA